MPYPFEKPVLSGREVVSIRKVLENRLTDSCFLVTFDEDNTIKRMQGSFLVFTWDGDESTTVKPSTTASYYRVAEASWGDSVSCRVASKGTGSKLSNNNTVFTTNIQLELLRSTAVTPAVSAPLAPSGGAYDHFLMIGTWIAYNNEVYRVTGINKPDSVPTIQRVDAELDDSTEDGEVVYIDDGENIKGYSTVGAAIRAVASIPIQGKHIIIDSGAKIATASGDAFITKGT